MENRLYKFMRAKYSEGVKTGKVRGRLVEYVSLNSWRVELDLVNESWKLVTPTNNIVDNSELIDMVLSAMETGDTTEIDRINKAVAAKKVETINSLGKVVLIRSAYYRADGAIGVEYTVDGRNSIGELELSQYILVMERAGVI